jgi:multisubunit Na+/H+ antiporter MnhB subunit
MDSFIVFGIIITIILLGGGVWLSFIFYKNDSENSFDNKSQLLKDQLFIWFNGDLLIKIILVWVVIILLDSITKFEMKLHKLTHPL